MRETLVALGLLAGLITGIVWLKGVQCEARWPDSQYSFMTKCMVNQDGVYVPEDRIWFDR